ncbi:AAA family ATPase [Roseospira marina]|uniref:AAA family ATPase n=1 Tax=Roseospira marina TaxID=140057 RepID=A0A5M6IBX0_9PROT|nr:AAA family ATPase [Roseospira marina]KAA5605457.1 AAA family ATPase [Roseospira marina]MBB4314543.1 hypothetical protein [Roseospira marina]MBB5088895.1 hypothetical protein [Roseospira marina]
MTFHFRPAVREQTPLLIGLAGPSGSGKTFSALRLAQGIAGEKPIMFLDTENGRGLHYADMFRYQYAQLEPPFTPARYIEGIKAAVEAGAGCVIIDSCSHLHEGVGGLLEMHEAALDRMAGQNYQKREACKFSAWIEPKKEQSRFVNNVLQVRAHVIFCFRAKEKMKMQKNDRGKNEPVSIGWQPIAPTGFEYEMTTMLVLPPGARGVPHLGAEAEKMPDQLKRLIEPGVQIDEGLGQRLAGWANGGAAPQQTQPSQQPRSAADPADFWARPSLTIGVTKGLEHWADRFKAAAAAAPNADALDRLRSDNADNLADLDQADPVAYDALMQALDAEQDRRRAA